MGQVVPSRASYRLGYGVGRAGARSGAADVGDALPDQPEREPVEMVRQADDVVVPALND